MKLALSNICLNSKEDFDRLVEEQGLAVESAYNKLDPRSIAVQSLFYDMPEGFHAFKSNFCSETQQRLLTIHNKVTHRGSVVVVFGAPKVRNATNLRGVESIRNIIQEIDGFTKGYCPRIKFCVENVPRNYGSLIYSKTEDISFHKHKLSLDIGNAFLENDPINFVNVMESYHVHISAPNLVPISACEDPEYFKFLRSALETLDNFDYSGYISIEMKPCTYWEAKESVLLVKEMLNGISNS